MQIPERSKLHRRMYVGITVGSSENQSEAATHFLVDKGSELFLHDAFLQPGQLSVVGNRNH